MIVIATRAGSETSASITTCLKGIPASKMITTVPASRIRALPRSGWLTIKRKAIPASSRGIKLLDQKFSILRRRLLIKAAVNKTKDSLQNSVG